MASVVCCSSSSPVLVSSLSSNSSTFVSTEIPALLPNTSNSSCVSGGAQGSLQSILFLEDDVGGSKNLTSRCLLSGCLAVSSESSHGSSLLASMAGGHELALVTLTFLGVSTLTGSLNSKVSLVNNPGWENVFDRLSFLKIVQLKLALLDMYVMPGSVIMSLELLESSGIGAPGRQE